MINVLVPENVKNKILGAAPERMAPRSRRVIGDLRLRLRPQTVQNPNPPLGPLWGQDFGCSGVDIFRLQK